MNNKNKRLYNSIRFNSVIGNILVSILFIIFFVGTFVFASGFFIEYIIESKFAEEQERISTISKMYEEGKDSKDIKRILDASDTSFIVVDSKDKVVYQNGENTCGANGKYITMDNGSEQMFVYPDTKADYLYPKDNGSLGFKFKEFSNKLVELYNDGDIYFSLTSEEVHSFNLNTSEEDEGVVVSYYKNEKAEKAIEDIKVPIWISIDLEDGNRFIGKALLSINIRDVILAFEILIAFLAFVILYIIIIVIITIFSAVNQNRIKKLFYKDMSTDAYNWMWFVVKGNKTLRKGINAKNNYAVVNLEFKNYRNYCLCHSIKEGDKLLARMNKDINKHLNSREMCAHATTANFALLMKYDDTDQLQMRIHEIIKALNDLEKDHEFTFKAGVAVLESEDIFKVGKEASRKRRKNVNIENVYNNASAAKVTIDDVDGAEIRIFDKKLFEEQQWTDFVHEKQWQALKGEEFLVYYQPKYDPKTNNLNGAEALIRWQSPEAGFITPGRFIPIFEKNGFITEIDHYMISHVARDQKNWLDQGMRCVPISVNVSRAHFVESDLAEQIVKMVDDEGCPHNLIEIELTESAFFDDKNAMIETIRKLKNYGFSVSMDDFGAGYSSLNSLKDMPLDVLKLDADFFRGENAGERGEKVVSEAIKLAKILEMRTVAEGVEEKEQVEFLKDQGCDLIQGYYFAKPMPKSEFLERIDQWQNWRVTEE